MIKNKLEVVLFLVAIGIFSLGFCLGKNQKQVVNVVSEKIPEITKTEIKKPEPGGVNLSVLRRQKLKLKNKTIEAVFTSGAGCVSCHGQTIYIYDSDLVLVIDNLTDPRVEVVDEKEIWIKSQKGGGGAPSKGETGIVKVFEFDDGINQYVQTREFEDEYTSEDYLGKVEVVN